MRLASLLGRAGHAGRHQVHDQALATDRSERLERQAVLAGEQLQRRDEPGPGGHDEARRALAEQVDGRRVADRQAQVRPEIAPHRAFGQGDREAAARHVLDGRDEAAGDRVADERLDGSLAFEVQVRQAVLEGRAGEGRIGRTRPDPARSRRPARPRRRPPRRPARRACAMSSMSPTTPISARRGDGAGRRLVVERDVAAGDRQAERHARIGEAPDAFGQLPERLGPGRVAVVEAVRHAERSGAGDRDVAGRLGDAQGGAQPRIERPDRLVAVRRGDEPLGRALDPQDGGPATRARRRCPPRPWSRTG